MFSITRQLWSRLTFFYFFRSRFAQKITEDEVEMFAFFSTVRQPCSDYVAYFKLARFYTTFQMDHYDDDAGSDRDDRPPPPSGGAGAVV